MQRAQPLELARFQRHRGVVAQARPLLPREYPVWIVLLIRCPNVHPAASSVASCSQVSRLRAAFSSSPDVPVRCCQRGLDLFKPDVARFQQHQQVKQQIRAFGDQVVAVILDRGNHGFHRFLAELLGAMLRALVEELDGVGRLAPRRRTGVDGDGQIMDRETRHQLEPNTRAAGTGALSPQGI